MNQFRNLSVTEIETLRKRLLKTVLRSRMFDFYNVKGKDRGREACHQVLVDCNKRQQFLEQQATGILDVAEYGKVLESVWGHETPQSFEDRFEKFHDDLIENLVCVKLQKEGYVQIYYTVSEVARENDFITASSEEEIRRIGRILYSTRDEDPAESFCDIIVRVYFDLAGHISTSGNEIFDSVRKGELQRVATYLDEEGGDVNSADEYGRSLIHHASHSGNMDMIRFLKDKGANVHAEDRMCGRKPIHIAAKEGHFSVISFFLDIGASANECDKINWTPLHYAVWKGDMSTIRFLTEHGADINAKEVCQAKTPIHIAAEHGYSDVIKYLIENGANTEDIEPHFTIQ